MTADPVTALVAAVAVLLVLLAVTTGAYLRLRARHSRCKVTLARVRIERDDLRQRTQAAARWYPLPDTAPQE